MIHSLERIYTEENKEGWFLINGSVKGRFITVDGAVKGEVEFDDKIITEAEALDLLEELYNKTLEFHKEINSED